MRHRERPSSACVQPRRECGPRHRSTTRVPPPEANVRTSAYVRWLRCPLAPVRLGGSKMPGLLRCRVPGDAPPTRLSRRPALRPAGSACVNHIACIVFASARFVLSVLVGDWIGIRREAVHILRRNEQAVSKLVRQGGTPVIRCTTLPLFIHERLSTKAILETLKVTNVLDTRINTG